MPQIYSVFYICNLVYGSNCSSDDDCGFLPSLHCNIEHDNYTDKYSGHCNCKEGLIYNVNINNCESGIVTSAI